MLTNMQIMNIFVDVDLRLSVKLVKKGKNNHIFIARYVKKTQKETRNKINYIFMKRFEVVALDYHVLSDVT